MKIQGNKPPEGQEINISVQKASKPEKDMAAAASTGRPRPLNDRVDISGAGKEVADLMAAVNQLPDVRDDKIKAIKEAIEAGKYHVDSVKIAGKLLEEL